jgi:ABC-type multidrug transport system fused ATPase/permease subunit
MDQKLSKSLGFKEILAGIKTVINYAEEQKKDFRVLIFITLALSILTAFVPYIWGIFVDSIGTYIKYSSVPIYRNPFLVLSFSFLITSIINILDWLKSLKARKVEETLRVTYRIKAHHHLLLLPVSFHVHNKAGEVQEKFSRAANSIYDVLTQTLLDNLPNVLTLVVSLVIVFSMKPIFGLISIVGFSISTVISFRNLKSMAIYQREMQISFKEAYGKMADNILNFRVVKDFTTENTEHEKIYRDFMHVAIPNWLKFFNKGRANSFIQSWVASITRLIVILLSLYYIFHGSMTIGRLIAINGLINFGAITTLINSRYRLQNSIISIEDAEEIFSTPTEVYDPEDAVKLERLSGLVEFNNLSFSYESGEPIVKNLTFKVEPGETIAFVGESGVGKSTLIDLLLGYYFPTQGNLIFDGVDTTRIPLRTIRGNIGVVPQEITLFNDTVFNNIRYGSPNATESEIITAATKAHCTDFIERFPLKWDQFVGERGMKLSVGQKQRIAIARAFLKDPSILILDEPTSALDANSEKIITKSIESLLKGRTTFIVAHRLSTVRKADRIMVFKEGKMVEQGSHDELVKKKGEYAKLYNLQNKAV